MKRHTFIALVLSLILPLSCERLPEDVNICGVGSREPSLEVSWNGGECTAYILASGAFTATIPEGTDWISFKENPSSLTLGKEGDCSITFTLSVNRSIPRSVEIELVCGTSNAFLTITQDGLLEGGLDVAEKNVLAPFAGGRLAAKVNTKIAASKFSFSTEYLEPESADWISGVRLSGNFIVFEVEPNLAESLIRHADIIASYPGGKGRVHITQYSAGTEPEPIGIASLKEKLNAKGSIVLDKHYIVSGIVLNDDSEGNGAENRMVSADNPDMSYSSTIIYLQSEDGADGIKLIFNGSCADVASRWDHISFDAFGLTLTRENAPVRYEISDIPISIVTASEKGEPVLPKTRSIAELVDNDLYTLVKLEEVEIPIRKGPYVPVDVRCIDIVTAYPVTLRDSRGKSIYMMVNSDCSWARDGKPMPQGSGSVSGVLVHESCDNYEWDTGRESTIKDKGVIGNYITGLGDIGSWQIRPVFHSDIEIAEDLDDGFSSLLYEWRYCDSLGVNLAPNYDGEKLLLRPTWPEVPDPRNDSVLVTKADSLVAKAALYCLNDGKKVVFKPCNDLTHLGPYTYGGQIIREDTGNGVTHLGKNALWYFQGGEKYGIIFSTTPSTTSDIRWETSNGSAWCAFGWNSKQYWCCEFSTEGLSQANAPLSVQFGTMNHIFYYGAPRYWSAEWSADGRTWDRLLTYSVPDFPPQTGAKMVWQLPGAKHITANLPNAALGKEKIYVRMIPTSAAGLSSNFGVGTASSYYSSSAFNAARYNAINYFAVRYNK